MKTPKFLKKQNLKEGTAKAVSFIAGDAHFMVKSTADGIVRAEASIVHSLTGKSKHAIVEDRHNKTEETQEGVKRTFARVTSFAGLSKSKSHKRPEGDLVTQ